MVGCSSEKTKKGRWNNLQTKTFLTSEDLVQVYHALFHSHVNYGLQILGTKSTQKQSNSFLAKFSYSTDDIFSTSNPFPTTFSATKPL